MKYSIVIPTYNHCDDLLKPCIESLIKYTDFKDVELIIVANGCTDNTKEYVNSLDLPAVKLVWDDQPLGYTKAANLGINAASGEYVVLLNNDTEILPSAKNAWLNLLTQPFLTNKKMALTGSLELFDSDIGKDFIVFCCSMIKRSIFQELGILDEVFSPGYGEDIDFTMRVAAAGYEWQCVDKTQFSPEIKMHVGTFPLWHKSNKTFGEIAEYSNYYVHRNRKILDQRYNNTENIKYSIVIPTYNHCDDLLKPCLESIKQYTSMQNIEIIVVANGCTDNTKDYVANLGKPFKLIWSEEPIGYTKATNLGMKAARGDYVVLLNNDTVLLDQPQDHWLKMLEQPFRNPQTGITGPLKFSWNCGGITREAMAFWLVMISKSLIEKIGYLDEIFSPGMGEDGDYCIRAVENGFNLVSVPTDVTGEFEIGPKNYGFPIYHVGNGTFGDDHASKDAMIFKNNKILDYRWGLQSRKQIDISIIVPTAHNFERALKPGLEALLKYTDLSNKEIIVVANGAPQESKDLLNELSDKLRYIWFDKPQGVVRAYNAGINAARGKYIVTIDDDSHLLPQDVDSWINILLQPFKTTDKMGATSPFAHEYEGLGFVLHSGCTMYDAELLKKLNGFDEVFNPGYFSDSDLALRIWKEGYKCEEVPVRNDSKKYENGVFTIKFPVMHLGDVQTMNKVKDIKLVEQNREKLYRRHGERSITASLEEMYEYYCNTPIDIHEHMPVLRKYASECDTIIEFGTRFVVSTYGFLAGKPSKMLCYDLYPHPNIWRADQLAKENGIQFGFMERDTTKIEIDPVDLLFIDTAHNYQQLKTELALHANKVKKYLIFHDTVSYGYKDEDGSPGGLMPAINEFLQNTSEWIIKEDLKNCNGLIVLERVKTNTRPTYSIVIPTYNHCDDLLKPCIESIVKYSNLESLEVIVVANGCTDNTRDYVEGLGSWAKLIWSDEALGYTKATNLGIKEAKGDYVVLLNNDTELLAQNKNSWLEMLAEPLKNNENGLSGPLELFDRYANSNVLIFFCVMIKRELFDKIGLLDEIFTPGGGEDIDFTVRANNAGYKSICTHSFRYENSAGTNVGGFPIWHKDNRTFRDIDEYSKVIVKRNGLINCKRYNKNIKLNLGAGGIEYPGYLSVDKYDRRAHIQMDIIKLDFDDNSVDEILASHVFEHLNPYKSLDILREWLRVLKPGGKLIMEMPDIEQLCKRFVTANTGERYGILNAIYGSVNTTDSGDPSDITSPHLFGWWPQSMWDHLVNAGFRNIVFMDEKIPHPESNFRVEAQKPMMDDLLNTRIAQVQEQDSNVFREIFVHNEYGISKNEIEGKIVIDIGANIGAFTLAALQNGAKHVYAIEAQHENFVDRLEKNIGGIASVTAINKAISHVDGNTVYLSNLGALSSVTNDAVGDSVQTITLQTLINTYALTSSDMVLKIDCEGSEFDVFMTTERDTLRQFSVIYTELHANMNKNPEWQDVDLIRDRLVSFGFTCERDMQYFMNIGTEQQTPMGVFVTKWVRI